MTKQTEIVKNLIGLIDSDISKIKEGVGIAQIRDYAFSHLNCEQVGVVSSSYVQETNAGGVLNLTSLLLVPSQPTKKDIVTLIDFDDGLKGASWENGSLSYDSTYAILDYKRVCDVLEKTPFPQFLSPNLVQLTEKNFLRSLVYVEPVRDFAKKMSMYSDAHIYMNTLVESR